MLILLSFLGAIPNLFLYFNLMALVRSRVNEKRQQIQFTDAAYSESYGSSSSQFVSASNAQTVKVCTF